jgi:hypothetical protein
MANQKPPNRPPIVPNFGQPQRRPMPPRPGLVPYNPKNYLRPNMRTAKVIDLNKAMSTWGAGQAKYKEGDAFISKKILQNLEKANDFAGVTSQDKFRKNLKIIDDIISGPKGEISYKFKGVEGYLAEEVLDQNYIHHYAENVLQYYKEKNKNETEEKS